MPAASPIPRRRYVFLLSSTLVCVSAIVAAREIMLPFVLAALIAYVLTPLVALAERRRVQRGWAVLLVYATVLGSIAAFVQSISPRIGFEVRALHDELPTLAAEARDTWAPVLADRLQAVGIKMGTVERTEPSGPPPAFVVRPQPDGSFSIDVGSGANVVEAKGGWSIQAAHDKRSVPRDLTHIVEDVVGRSFAYAQENSLEIARAVRNVIATVSRGIFVFFITLMLAAYLMVTRERVYAFFRSLVPPGGRGSFDMCLARIDAGLSGVVRGQLLICAINGVLSAIGFGCMGLKYWPVMALLAAIFSLIPIFGSIASAIPAVAVGLTQSLSTAFFVLVWIVGIHQLEANVFNPKIMGDAAKIHPVLVIFSLLVGEHFFHVVGALLAVPTMSIVQSLFLHFRDATELDGDAEIEAALTRPSQ